MTDAPSESSVLLVVGSATRDLDRADPRGWRLGGSVVYCSLTAARLGVRVRALVGADEQAAGAPELELLRAAGAEVAVVPLERGPIFENRQTPGGRIQFGHEASDQIPVAAVPGHWRKPSAVLLGPVAGEIGDDWASIDSQFVALAWQGLLREVVQGQAVRRLPPERRVLTERADLVVVGNDDAAAGGPPLHSLLRDGQQLVVTHGPLGALSLRRTRGGRLAVRLVPALTPRVTVDETGAGDVFLAALCAGRLLARADDDWRLLALAAAAASASVEGAGLASVPTRPAVGAALIRLREELLARQAAAGS